MAAAFLETWQFVSARKNVIFFLVLLLVAFGLRIFQLDKNSLWFDELHSIVPTHPENSFTEVVEYAKTDQPPLFFIMLHAWFKIFPYNEVSGRVMCALVGLAGSVLLYFFAGAFFNKRTALIVFFLASINIYLIYYSQELRFYSLLFLLSTGSFFTFMLWMRDQTRTRKLAFILMSVLIMYTHYYGMIVVLSQGIIYIIIGIVNRYALRYFVAGFFVFLASIVCFAPWLPTVFRDSTITQFWIPELHPYFFVDFFVYYFQGWWGQSHKAIIIVPLFFLMLYGVWCLKQNAKTASTKMIGYVFVGWFVLTLALPYAYSLITIPVLTDRYTIVTLPVILLLIAVGIDAIPSGQIRLVVFAVIIFFSIRTYSRYISKYDKPDFRKLSELVIEENSSKIPVVSTWAWHFNYYFRKAAVSYEVLHLEENVIHQNGILATGFWLLVPGRVPEQQKAQFLIFFRISKVIDLSNGMEAYQYLPK